MEYDIEQIEKQNEKRKRTKQIVKKLLFVIIIILLYNIFLITKSTLDKTDAKSMFGYRAYVITTNSMEPTINVGDIIIVSGIEKDKIKTDKIVTFEQNNQIITHRIVGIEETEKGSKYVTKGDNNLTKDTEEISYEQILGTIVLKIPRIGNIILLLEDKIYIILLLNLILIIYINTKKIISALPRKVLWLILILMIIYNVINTVYGVFDKKLDLRIGKATMYTTEDKTMIPTIKTNDLIITKKCQPDDLNLQDIIIFDENGITKIQRITKIQGHGENSYYTTKGDNNYHNNNVIIEYNQIKGKFEKRIPLLGLIVKMLQSKITTVFVIIILVLLFVFNRDMKMKSIKRRKNKKIDQLRKQNN